MEKLLLVPSAVSPVAIDHDGPGGGKETDERECAHGLLPDREEFVLASNRVHARQTPGGILAPIGRPSFTVEAHDGVVVRLHEFAYGEPIFHGSAADHVDFSSEYGFSSFSRTGNPTACEQVWHTYCPGKPHI